VNRSLEQISREPMVGPQIKRLRGSLEGSWRCRVGDLRIIYRVDLTARFVWIETIGPRGSVYG
jgi:mRNA interferase RelE/StbE